MLASLKRRAHEHLRGQPGRRFQDRYRDARRVRQKRGAGRRVLNLVLAFVALAVGGVLSVIPGPAIPFFFAAGLLLASESLTVARGMDWLEVKLRAAFHWARLRWNRLPRPARLGLKILASCVSLTLAYFSWQLWRR